MKDVLVTGANGQLGSALAKQASFHPGIRLHLANRNELDIVDLNSTARHFQNNHYYGVINCAAYTAVDQAETNREAAFSVNSSGAANLASVCLDSSSKLFHISTDYVFDGQKRQPYLETDAVNPICVYGESKAEGERRIQEVMPEAAIFRTSWLVDSVGNNFVNTMRRLGAQREAIQVVNDQVASPTWAPLLAKGLLSSMEADEKLEGIFHFAHDGECSWNDFAKLIFEIEELDCQVEAVSTAEFGAPAPRPLYSKLDTTKLKESGSFEFPSWVEASRRHLQPKE